MGKLLYMKVNNISQTSAEIYFYGEIVGDEWDKWSDTDTCPQDVLEALKETEGKELNIYINSPGGSVFAGLAIYNMLCRKKEKKICYIDGLAGSIASVIAMAGDEILMPENGFLMIHKPSAHIGGNAVDMRKMAEDLDRIQCGIEAVYQTKLKKPETLENIRQLMEEETWLTAKEAEQYFNLTVTKGNLAVARLDSRVIENYKNIPEILKAAAAQSEIKNKSEESIRKLRLELALMA